MAERMAVFIPAQKSAFNHASSVELMSLVAGGEPMGKRAAVQGRPFASVHTYEANTPQPVRSSSCSSPFTFNLPHNRELYFLVRTDEIPKRSKQPQNLPSYFHLNFSYRGVDKTQFRNNCI